MKIEGAQSIVSDEIRERSLFFDSDAMGRLYFPGSKQRNTCGYFEIVVNETGIKTMSPANAPLFSLLQRVFDPLIVSGALYTACLLSDEALSGYYIILLVLACFLSSAIFQYVGLYQSSTTTSFVHHSSEIIFSCVLTATCLISVWRLSHILAPLNKATLGIWLALSSLGALLTHSVAQVYAALSHHERVKNSAILVGINGNTFDVVSSCRADSRLRLDIRGFFEDRSVDRLPHLPVCDRLGRLDEVAAYVRKRKIRVIFISYPISAQPRIRKLTEELLDTTVGNVGRYVLSTTLRKGEGENNRVLSTRRSGIALAEKATTGNEKNKTFVAESFTNAESKDGGTMTSECLNGESRIDNFGYRFEVALPPSFAALQSEVDCVCSNPFCSTVRLPNVEGTSLVLEWLAYKDNILEAAILFSCRKNRVIVLSELLNFNVEVIGEFAKYIFANYVRINLVMLPSVREGGFAFRFPYQRYNSTEDIVITLPRTLDEYLGRLGSSTRSNLRRYQKRVAHSSPEMKFEFYRGRDATDQIISSLIHLSTVRVKGKNQIPSHTEDSVAELKRMVASYGVVLVATVNGRICGGVICTAVGNSFFMHVLAHDPCHDHLRLGFLCCYLSICDAIRRGARGYHLLSGKYDYKFRLNGRQVDFDKIVIYRSKVYAVVNWVYYLACIFFGRGRELKKVLRQWSSDRKERESDNRH
jgi:hypothetical protein